MQLNKEIKLVEKEVKDLKKVQKKERKVIKTMAGKREIVVADFRKTGGLEKDRRKASKKAVKDKLFLKYLKGLVDPDNSSDLRVPDGFPVPTACVKSIQTVEVVGNFNADSIGNGDGGRFFFQVSPSIGQGIVGGDSYLAIETPYTNIGPIQTNNNTKIVLGTKLAGMNPSVVWTPGWIQDNLQAKEKKKEKKSSTVDHQQDLKDLREKGGKKVLRKDRRNHRILADSSYNGYEFWKDPVTDVIAGSKDLGVVTFDDIGGLASLIRPVAMSVWFECERSELDNGGSVAAALLPAGATAGQIIPYDYTGSTPTPPDTYAGWTGYGPLENWENLSQVPGAYQGKLKEGTYSYWVPQRISDVDMQTPLDTDMNDFPTICVAGQLQPINGLPTAESALIGRLRIVTHYEYCSENQVASLRLGGVSMNFLEKVKMILHDQPTSCANGQHLAWIKKLLATAAGGVLGFVTGGPAGAVGGAMTGFELGSTWAKNSVN